jgi:hypothetical protein
LIREEFLMCLLTLENLPPSPWFGCKWSAAFTKRPDAVIAAMRLCNAMQESPIRYQLLFPTQ